MQPDPLADEAAPNAARVLQRIIRAQTGVIVKEHICRRIIDEIVQPARELGISEGLRQADNAINWGVSCLGCADKLDGLIEERGRGYDEGLAVGRRQAHEADEQALVRFGAFIANDIRAELVCCDIYEHAHGDAGRVEAAERSGHAICFWGEAAARIAEGRDDDAGEPTEQPEQGVCNCESYEPCNGECCGPGNCSCSLPAEQGQGDAR